MKIIKVNSLPLKEVIRDLAKCFETTFEESCNYYSLNIPEDKGSGNIRGINFTNGMGILLYDCIFLEDVEIQFIVNDIHPLKFLFCSEGTLYHRFENDIEHLYNSINIFFQYLLRRSLAGVLYNGSLSIDFFYFLPSYFAVSLF